MMEGVRFVPARRLALRALGLSAWACSSSRGARGAGRTRRAAELSRLRACRASTLLV
jgi:hypothetical protein